MSKINIGFTAANAKAVPTSGKVSKYDENGVLHTNNIDLDKSAPTACVNLSLFKAAISPLEYDFIALAIELETTKNAELNGMGDNVFIETFINLDDIILIKGTYDSVARKLKA